MSAFPFPTTGGPLWLGVEVVNRTDRDDTLCAAHGGRRLIWLRDLAHAESVCFDPYPTCEPLCLILERAGTRATIDFCGAESFAEFVELCHDEITHVQPDFDDPGEEALCKDAVRLLHAATQKGDAR
jgi:hypothetical protein